MTWSSRSQSIYALHAAPQWTYSTHYILTDFSVYYKHLIKVYSHLRLWRNGFDICPSVGQQDYGTREKFQTIFMISCRATIMDYSHEKNPLNFWELILLKMADQQPFWIYVIMQYGGATYRMEMKLSDSKL